MEYVRLALQFVLINIFRVGLIFFADFRVRGLNNLNSVDRSRGVIFASNHSSQLDVLMIPAALPFINPFLPMYYVSLENKYYQRFPIGRFFYGKWLFDLLGGITAVKGYRNYALSLQKHVELLRSRGSLCIFPEGQVIPGRGVGPAKGGVGYLSEATGATIIPVALNDNHDLRAFDFFTFRRKMTVVFGKPTTFDELYHEVLKDLETQGITVDENLNIKNPHKAVAQKLVDMINEFIKKENGDMK